MPDHIHAPPVCGYAPHSPHAPSCGGMTGRMIACGTITDLNHPNAGQCLCRHEAAKAVEALPMVSQPAPSPAPAAKAAPVKKAKKPAKKKAKKAKGAGRKKKKR